MDKKVQVAAQGAGALPVEHLSDFQGELKTLTDENYEKLKSEILTLGFSEPISVWKNKNRFYILNGHQRVKTLRRMQEDGYKIPKIPVSFVEAKNVKEAKEKVLALTSQYGVMTTEGLAAFAKEAGLALDEIAGRYIFPEIDIADLDAAAKEAQAELDGEVDENKTDVSFEAFKNATVKQIVLYFSGDDYQKVIKRMDELVAEKEADDYSNLIWKLLFD